jgi:hypothetical protein
MVISRKPQSLVTFIIGRGDEEQTFVVHKEFVTFYSSFFAAAFEEKSGCFEAETQTMKLLDADAMGFGKIVHWLYTKHIEVDGEDSCQLYNLAVLWNLAGQFKIVDLQNSLMSDIINGVKADDGVNMVPFLRFAY